MKPETKSIITKRQRHQKANQIRRLLNAGVRRQLHRKCKR